MSGYTTTIYKKWQLTPTQNVHTSWWQTCSVETHYHARIAQFNQTSTSSFTTILDIQRGINCWRWINLERNQNCYTNQAAWSYSETDSWRTLGLNKCKLHAKETVYCPGLNDQLENLVLNCELCLKYSNSKCKQEPRLLLGHEVPLYPWTKLATDVFHFEAVSYLLVVDYTSRFPVVCKLTLMTGQHIASHFKLICSEYGWPETLVSDNGPCYTSKVFTNLMREYNANHITISPHYPQSNELAEKYVQLVKNLFYKAKEEGKDLFKCLMMYWNTPFSNSLHSPMQILTSRSAESNLPISNAARKQLGLDCKDLRTKYKNEHLPSYDLHLNQVVTYQDPKTKRWFPATITKLSQEPGSYIITTKEGVQDRKTQTHLKPYHPQDKIVNSEHVLQNNHMQTVNTLNSKQSTTDLA